MGWIALRKAIDGWMKIERDGRRLNERRMVAEIASETSALRPSGYPEYQRVPPKAPTSPLYR